MVVAQGRHECYNLAALYAWCAPVITYKSLMSAASPTNSPLLHQRYRIHTRLGEGRLATVYRAEDERLKRMVLVHILRLELAQQESLRRRFEEEAQHGAQRSHPGLLEVYDSGEVSGRPYMVTEDVMGKPLAEQGRLAANEALALIRTIVSAVALAQTQGVPYPPVTSQNVWLLGSGRTVLVENWNMPPQNAPLDLAPYRAPERVAGAPPSEATSVYALGILAWEAFVGRRPFDGATPAEIAEQQRQGELPPISQARPTLFSPELDRIVAQAVASDPGMRYPSPVDFGRALDHYAAAVGAQTGRLASLPVSQPEPETIKQRRPFARRAPNTAAAPAIPPPPPPVIVQEPPRQTRTIAHAAPLDQRALDKQVQRSVRKELRRQGCQRTLVKRSLQLLFVFLLLYGMYLGVRYTVDYVTGRIQQIDPGQWLSQQLPDLSDIVPSWVSTPNDLTATYRITQPINLRSEPGAITPETIVQVLEPGVRVQQLGPPQADPQGGQYQWIRVVVLPNGTQGWVALIGDRLERQ